MTHNPTLLRSLLDNLDFPYVFCDTNHVIRYMNAVAVEKYEGRPAEIGRSIFECHNAESNAQIEQVAKRLAAGEDEVLITDDEKHRIYMRAIRDASGEFLGYFERYEPPR